MAELLADAVRYAREAAAAIDRLVAPAAHTKARFDIVTDADLAAEAAITAAVRAAHPHDAVVAEEAGTSPGTSGRTWWVDPLDGTHNFARGSDRWAISIGATDARGTGVCAVVFAPQRDELYTAVGDGAAHLNGRVLRVRPARRLDDAMVASGFGHRPGAEASLGAWSRVAARVRGVRCQGSAALDLCEVAAGRLDAYFERGLGPWDTAAGLLVAVRAGAEVWPLRNPNGRPPTDLLVARPGLGAGLHPLVGHDII